MSSMDCWQPTVQLAPGVRGFAEYRGDEIYIPLIVAEVKGNGDVGRFLDGLTPRCVIIEVTSPRLEEMLKRRGWKSNKQGEWRRG